MECFCTSGLAESRSLLATLPASVKQRTVARSPDASWKSAPSRPRRLLPIALSAALMAKCGGRQLMDRMRRRSVRLHAVQRRQLLAEVAAGSLASGGPLQASASEQGQRKLLRLKDGEAQVVDVGSGVFAKEDLRQIDIALLGEHHNQRSDHQMQADFVAAFAEAQGERGAALGLEMVEQPFQPVLDRFNAGELSVSDLYKLTEWSKRWVWDFDLYAPIFEVARAKGMPLVALNTATEVQREVPIQGIAALNSADIGRYLPDRAGFAATLRSPGFLDYAENVIMPSYDTHRSAGWLGSQDAAQATPQFFMLARVLRDEAMASAAWRYLEVVPEGESSRPKSMVVLVGADHVKFGYGMTERLRRLSAGRQRFAVKDTAISVQDAPRREAKVLSKLGPNELFEAGPLIDAADGTGMRYRQLADGRGFARVETGSGRPPSVLQLPGEKRSVASVVLNPTGTDTLAALGGAPLLQLPLNGLPQKEWPKLADWIWFDSTATKIV